MDRARSPHPPAVVNTTDEKSSIEKDSESEEELNTISVTFTVDDRVGMLKDVLEIFAKNGVSLSLIESRPGAKPGSYDFFVQFKEINNTLVQEITGALESLPTCKSILILNAKEGN